jgi:hypothetical protein
MNYKALADKLRKALGIEDPDTLAEVLDFGEEGEEIPKSLSLKTDIRLLKSNRQNVIESGMTFFKDFGEGKAPWTMEALDAALRERLELVWMRRRRRPAA